MQAIDSFQGEYRFLSNFWPAPVELDGVTYPTVEHAYQAAKTLNKTERIQILRCETPGQAKRVGKRVTMRKDWDTAKLQVMADLVEQKFNRHPHLKARLLATGDRKLIEGNTWNDTFWGICNGKGLNMLGEILMQVREELKSK